MSKLPFVFKAFIFVVTVFACAAGLAQAQATRTWISGVGDDVNPCSRTAPCKTFAGAISKTAAGGEINCIDSGGFGAVTITKSMTLDGTGCMASILASGTTGIIINISDTADAARTVRIRNLAINGAGTTPGIQGIRIVSANRVYIENTVIDGFSKSGISIENTAAAAQVLIKNTTVRNNGNGVNVKPAGWSVSLLISNSYLEGNSLGISSTEKSELTVVGSVIAGNETGVQASSGSIVRLSNVTVTGNSVGLSAAGGNIVSFKNNTITGNGRDGAPTSVTAQQ